MSASRRKRWKKPSCSSRVGVDHLQGDCRCLRRARRPRGSPRPGRPSPCRPSRARRGRGTGPRRAPLGDFMGVLQLTHRSTARAVSVSHVWPLVWPIPLAMHGHIPPYTEVRSAPLGAAPDRAHRPPAPAHGGAERRGVEPRDGFEPSTPSFTKAGRYRGQPRKVGSLRAMAILHGQWAGQRGVRFCPLWAGCGATSSARRRSRSPPLSSQRSAWREPVPSAASDHQPEPQLPPAPS